MDTKSISCVDIPDHIFKLTEKLKQQAGNAVDDNPRPEVVQEILAGTFKELAMLSPVEYDQCRKFVADNLGIRLGTLDGEVEKYRVRINNAIDNNNYNEPASDGKNVIFPLDTPSNEIVDGAALLDNIAAIFQRFVALPKHASTALALWTLHTYSISAANHTPILALTSPTKRCGKTTLLSVLGRLVNRALVSSNVTAAVVFRAVEKWTPTLLIDEADSFMRNNEALRGVLNSGHSRGAAFVLRNVNVGDNYEPVRFSTWCAKAIALIGKLPNTLTDRSIEIKLRRRLPSEMVERFQSDKFDGSLVRGMAVRWVSDHLTDFDVDKNIPAGLNDRARDNWRPLFAIAEVAGGDWPHKAHIAALVLSSDFEEDDAAVQLLQDVATIMDSAGLAVIASRDLIERLVLLDERPWQTWNKGRQISPRQLSKLLQGFKIFPAPRREGANVFKGYRRCDLGDALSRYTP